MKKRLRWLYIQAALNILIIFCLIAWIACRACAQAEQPVGVYLEIPKPPEFVFTQPYGRLFAVHVPDSELGTVLDWLYRQTLLTNPTKDKVEMCIVVNGKPFACAKITEDG